jgi:hypothetical protein
MLACVVVKQAGFTPCQIIFQCLLNPKEKYSLFPNRAFTVVKQSAKVSDFLGTEHAFPRRLKFYFATRHPAAG